MKVRINTSSWHYRLIYNSDFRVPGNLCAYFWKVVFLVVWYIVASVVVFIGVFAALMAMLLPLFGVYIGAGLIATVVLYVMLGSILIDLYRETDHYRARATNSTADANIAIEWVKAKKNKVCPMLEFE